MDAIEAGNVSIILVKDMSRLGRDYLRVGLLMEQLHEKGIRLIAVNDGIDTERGEDDFIPFRNIFAEWHARDTSRKINAVFKSRMENGKRCSGSIPYGYLRENGDVQNLIIDEEAAAVIRRIYQMVIEGVAIKQIARTLMNECVPIPTEHYRRIGQEYRDRGHLDPYGWSPGTIYHILRKPEYKGTVVLGTTKKTTYKGKRKYIRTPPEEWYVFENAIPAIVDTETWETVQRLRKTVRREPICDDAPNPLTGLLFCADCGAKLSVRRSKNSQGYRESAYACSRHRIGIIKTCSLHYISIRAVEKLVLETVRSVSEYAINNTTDFIAKVRETSAIKQENAVKENKKTLVKSKRRHAELNELIRKLYEGNASGRIPDKHFERMLADYDTEQTATEAKITGLEIAIADYSADTMKADSFIELTRRHTEFDTLTATVLNEYIEKIIVHNADRSSGKRVQKVEIHLNFIGEFTVPESDEDASLIEYTTAAGEREKPNTKDGRKRKKTPTPVAV